MQLHPFINILKINNKLKETIFWNQIKNETCVHAGNIFTKCSPRSTSFYDRLFPPTFASCTESLN